MEQISQILDLRWEIKLKSAEVYVIIQSKLTFSYFVGNTLLKPLQGEACVCISCALCEELVVFLLL